MGAKKVKTKVIHNTTEPKWFFTEDFPIEVIKGQDLKIEIFDYDFIGENDFLGKIIIPTSMVADQGSIDKMWAELENVKSGKIQLSLTWLQATLDKSILHLADEIRTNGLFPPSPFSLLILFGQKKV